MRPTPEVPWRAVMELQIGDEFVREVFNRARELGLLDQDEPDPWLTTEQAADYLGLSTGHLHNYVIGAIEQKIREAKQAGSLMEVNSIDSVTGELAISPDHIAGVVIGL